MTSLRLFLQFLCNAVLKYLLRRRLPRPPFDRIHFALAVPKREQVSLVARHRTRRFF
jgi:hypothetical protein